MTARARACDHVSGRTSLPIDPMNGGFDGDTGTPGLKEDITVLAN